ncbi:MAG: membrane protease YdiL (CAAX protease family) [Flavobacteriales bacterium]|jgi:membrane protease YdiL (CAAX protease family)
MFRIFTIWRKKLNFAANLQNPRLRFMKAVFETMHPLAKALMYLCLLVVMSTIALAIGGGIAAAATTLKFEELSDMGKLIELEGGRMALMIMNATNQIVGLLGSALLFMLFFGKSSVDGFWTKKWSRIIAFIPLLAFFSLPLIQASFEFNSQLIPEGSFLEETFKPTEELAEQITVTMLQMDGPLELIVILILVAVLPAICEEFAFRGVLQAQLAKSFGNVHLGIWVSAFIFSAIHFQFYGFIPRMLLGAFFGYLLIHSGSIWTSVVAHFFNNALAVMGAYFAGQIDSLDTDRMESATLNPYFMLFATVAFTLLFWVVLQKSTWKSIKGVYLKAMSMEDILPPQDPESALDSAQ